MSGTDLTKLTMGQEKDDKAIECSPKKKKDLYYLHVAIGLAIMAILWFMPPIEPITAVGMRCAAAFLGMVYLWSTAGTLWPSVLGLFLLAISGFAGEGAAGFKLTVLNALGADTVVLTMLAMILFGALDEAGCTRYIAHWFVTRKIITGRPYAFMSIFFVCVYVLSTLVSPITALIILWPISLRIMDTVKVERCDKVWPFFFVGMFAFSTLGQPLFPFMGAQLVVVSAFEGMTQGKYPILANAGPYMALNLIMTAIIGVAYILALKFVIRVDVSKFKAIDAEKIARDEAMPPMNIVQKLYMFMVPMYLLMLLAPSFVPETVPGISFLKTMGPVGVTILWIVIFTMVKIAGKELLDFKEVAYKQFNWGIYFMIAAAVYGANTLSNPATGVPDFLLETLNPILGGRSEMVFVAILFTTALILTNFANNAAMAVILMPVILAFSGQMGINPMPVAMGVCMMVFVAMLTPAASPHAGMMHGRKDIYETIDIMKIGFPICLVTLLFYIFIGYPLAKILFGV